MCRFLRNNVIGGTIMDITFEKGTEEYMIYVFDWDTDDESFIVNENGDRVPATDGDPIKLEELGGIVKRNGLPTPLRDNFCSIADYVDGDIGNHEEITELD